MWYQVNVNCFVVLYHLQVYLHFVWKMCAFKSFLQENVLSWKQLILVV